MYRGLIAVKAVDGSWYVSGRTDQDTTHPLVMKLTKEQADAIVKLDEGHQRERMAWEHMRAKQPNESKLRSALNEWISNPYHHEATRLLADNPPDEPAPIDPQIVERLRIVLKWGHGLRLQAVLTSDIEAILAHLAPQEEKAACDHDPTHLVEGMLCIKCGQRRPFQPSPSVREKAERDKWCSRKLPSGMYDPMPAFSVIMEKHFSKRDAEIIWNDIAKMVEYLIDARKEQP